MTKLLFLAANPLDTDPLRLDEEMRACLYALRIQITLREELCPVSVGTLNPQFIINSSFNDHLRLVNSRTNAAKTTAQTPTKVKHTHMQASRSRYTYFTHDANTF